jgi:hypothetical protein
MKISIKPAMAALSLGVALMAASGPASAAAVTFTNTTGGATTGTGPYTLTSTDSTYSVLRWINNEAFDFGDITSLDLDYNAILGGIGQGAPRLVIVTDADHNGLADSSLTVYLGPAASFVDPTLGPANSGNLIGMNDLGRYDVSDAGGLFYSDYASALANAGSYGVLRFSLVLDSYGGADKTFEVAADGLHVSATAGVPEPGMWMMMIAGFGMIGATLRRRAAVTA